MPGGRPRHAARLADQGFETQVPAGLGRGLESRQLGIALPERHRRPGPVHSERRAEQPSAGTVEEFDPEVQVIGDSEGFFLAHYRQRALCPGEVLNHQLFLSVRICSARPKGPLMS
ncbi:hypothetical protein AHiyo8_61690 [Arthrobacter sp. Hiyo8]|nr:hypothetical protein AHiyo8_61690 [Arthrobacter sp. Hiyo8]